MSVGTESGQTLVKHISGLIIGGWRKGVDGEGSALIYNTLKSGGDNKAVREMVDCHCQAIGEAAAPLVERRAPVAEIAKAMKEAAQVLPDARVSDQQMTPLGEGRRMFRALLPIEFKHYSEKRISAEPMDEYGRIFERNEYLTSDNQWEFNGLVGEDIVMTVGFVLLKLMQEVPAVKEYFEQPGMNVFIDNEADFKERLSKAVEQVTDKGWERLAGWVLYCLNIKES